MPLYPLPCLLALAGGLYLYATAGWLYVLLGAATLLTGLAAFLGWAGDGGAGPVRAPIGAGGSDRKTALRGRARGRSCGDPARVRDLGRLLFRSARRTSVDANDDVRRLLEEIRDTQREHLAEYKRVTQRSLQLQEQAVARQEQMARLYRV